MILTLTLNPAIDRNVSADRLVFDDRAYILTTDEAPGGRGINASMVIHSFGGKTVAIAPAGGESGERFRQHIAKRGFDVDLIPVSADMRTSTMVCLWKLR